MDIRQRVNKLINKQPKVDEWKLTSYMLCKTFGWDYYTLMQQPIPFIWDMIEMIQFEAEESKKAMEDKPGKKGKVPSPRTLNRGK